MKQVLLIGGGLAVVGGLAYLYLKNKKKEEAILTGGTSATQPIATTPTGTTSGASDGGIAPLPKGSTITPTTIDGVTTSVITTPSNTVLTVQNQMELDAILDSIKKNMELSRKKQISIGLWKPSNAYRSSGGSIGAKPSNPYPKIIEKLKNDLLKLGYEVKEGSGGLFLVKI
jgi:hypothetical protein